MTSLTWDRHQGHAYTYDVVALGYNYRIDEIRSALGLVQLHKLEANNGLRKNLTERYWEAFDNAQIGLPFRHAGGQPAYHIFPILLPKGVDRLQFIDRMRSTANRRSCRARGYTPSLPDDG
jgi:dTDP-4-amino-4,6-dideoxygalactose transaminase